MTATGTPQDLARNEALLRQLASEPIHRLPWRAEREYSDFMTEVSDFQVTIPEPTFVQSEPFDEELYLRRYPDVAAAGFSGLDHRLQYGRYEGREWR